jgi:hypothetical protein
MNCCPSSFLELLFYNISMWHLLRVPCWNLNPTPEIRQRSKTHSSKNIFYSSPKHVNFGKLFQTHVTWGGGATPPPHVTCVVVAIPIPDPENGLFEQCKQGSSPSSTASRTVYWLSGWSLSHISVNWTAYTRWHFLWCIRNERCKIRNVHVNWTSCNEMWY